TWLFIGFSFFLILSAILLAALMFQLGVRLRVNQIGLLEAVGFTPARARRLLTAEGGVVALAGTVIGAVLAVQFARLMIHGLTTWWVGAIGTTFLRLELRPQSLVIAAAVSFGLSVFVIWNAVRRTTQREPRELLQGLASDHLPGSAGRLSGLLSQLLYFGSIVTAISLPTVILAGLMPASEAFGGMSWTIVCFFLAGFAWLATGLLSLKRLLQRRAGDAVTGSPIASLTSLSLANAARNPQRSLLTAALIAFAAFVIVAVGAGRRNPVGETPDLQTGNGGFRLVAESSQPILFDLNTSDGRLRLGLDASDATRLPARTQIYSFPVRPGEDASCLNLFQTSLPGILGASPDFIARGGFRFADTPGQQPWTLLTSDMQPRTVPEADQPLPVIPVIGDLNTLQFSLKKKIGDVILFPDSQTPTHALQVVGMLDSSIFQGVLVMSADRLQQIAPEISGSRYFLIETPDAASGDVAAGALETALQPFGVDCELVSRRLAGFLAVQNTYLATFQLLGGLGLLMGTLGLAAVMLRNVLERRREIALLRALGFRTSRIIWLISAENSALLFWGLITGTVSALIAMLPHLKSTGADVPWQELAVTLAAVAAVGTLAAAAPIRAAVKVQVREVLAGE
ncbi:MAG: FtsX-like permease family protein, partial [Planctomyces sp.]